MVPQKNVLNGTGLLVAYSQVLRAAVQQKLR
jgi:hypothetical protein